METSTVVYVGIAALVGGTLNALLGWAKQSPPVAWDWRSFITSFIAALIGAGGIAVAFNYSGIQNLALALIAAALSGAGVTSAVSRISGAIAARMVKIATHK